MLVAEEYNGQLSHTFWIEATTTAASKGMEDPLIKHLGGGGVQHTEVYN